MKYYLFVFALRVLGLSNLQLCENICNFRNFILQFPLFFVILHCLWNSRYCCKGNVVS